MVAEQKKKLFINWAFETKSGPKKLESIKAYASVLSRISSIIGKDIGMDFFDIDNEQEFSAVRKTIESIDNYEQFNKDYQNMIISASLNLFERFIKTKPYNQDEDWFPVTSAYNPNVSKDQWLDFLKNSGLFNDNYKQMMTAMIAEGGQASCTQLTQKYGDTVAHYNMTATHMAEHASDYLKKELQTDEEGKKRYWSFMFVGKSASTDEPGSFIWKLRTELFDALNEYGIGANPKGNKTGSFDSWEIISNSIALKHCDKSFFAYHGSGVPKEICWFFDAENLQPGKEKAIRFQYGHQHSYTGKLSNDSTDRRRVRIFWETDLGKQFDAYKDSPNATAKFTKIDTDTYEISFGEGGKEMTVKDQLAQIKEYIVQKGFSYEGNLIDNFWLSLKSKPFVLLAGTSGTGKTRLVRLFAEAIGATNENGRYKLVSVRPDWSDSSDLFGHVDLNGHFVPGAIIDFVKKAELDPDYPYFLCLDEMNLARVEYYLSDFLSVIETRERKNGMIVTDPLVNPFCYGRDTTAAGRYGKVILPENLYVIGTVNMDETTFPFSRKVLDRANTIEFSFVKLNELPAPDSYVSIQPLSLTNGFLKTEYLSLKECIGEDANFQVLCDKLEEINLILAKAGAHVGYRVRDEIVFYLLNNKKNALLSSEEAFDNEIMQKILPRIQGSSTSVKNMLCDLFRYCAGDYTGLGGSSDSEQMSAYIEQKSSGKYPRSAEKIVFMTRRFEEDGFTSYWL